MSGTPRSVEKLDAARRELLRRWLDDGDGGAVGGQSPLSEKILEQPGGVTLREISAAEMLQVVAEERARAAELSSDLLIYLHVPFCTSKCSFCDWVSDIPGSQLLSGPPILARYARAVARQAEFLGPRLADLGYRPRMVYWGGGTPSRLESSGLLEIARALNGSFDLSELEEHTMETSPETLSVEKLRAIRSVGVTRLSMGIQSFDDEELRLTGRAHNGAQAEEAVDMIRQTGFDNFNLDLILGLPEQTIRMLDHTLEKTVACEPTHVTLYVYRAIEGTAMARQLARGRRRSVSPEWARDAYERSRRVLERAGYHEYITGYFAREAEHYFKGEEYYYAFRGDYLGLGSGANSLMGRHLLENHGRRLERFLSDPLHFDAIERYSPERPERVLSTLQNAVVTDVGIDFASFRRIFGFDFSEIREEPSVRAVLQYYRYCGAELREEGGRLFVEPETRTQAYINALTRGYQKFDAL